MEEGKDDSKLSIAIIHPDLGIGGAERLIVDAALELSAHGHHVHIFTSHHDKTRCFEETVSGVFCHYSVTIITNICIHSFIVGKGILESGWVYVLFMPVHVNYSDIYRYLPCYGSWSFSTSPYLLSTAYCMCISAVYICCALCAVPVSFFRHYSCRSGVCCHSADEVEKVFKDLLLAQHTTILGRVYWKPIDFIEEMTTGMADLILVNSNFTASTFVKTFKHLNSRGVRPAVLYPAVNVDQFDEPDTTTLSFLSINRFERKKNIELAIAAFAKLYTTGVRISLKMMIKMSHP